MYQHIWDVVYLHRLVNCSTVDMIGKRQLSNVQLRGMCLLQKSKSNICTASILILNTSKTFFLNTNHYLVKDCTALGNFSIHYYSFKNCILYLEISTNFPQNRINNKPRKGQKYQTKFVSRIESSLDWLSFKTPVNFLPFSTKLWCTET